MPWERSWKMAYCGAVYGPYVPPSGSDQDGGKRCGGETKPKDSLLPAQGDLQQRGKHFDFTKLPSYQRLPSTFQALLQSILDFDDKAKKEAMDIFHGKAADEQDAAGDRKLAKAMVAAFTEIEEKKQELLKPTVSAPPGPPSTTIGSLQKARNEAVAATRKAVGKVEKSQKLLLELREQEAAATKQHEIYLAEAEELSKKSQLAEQELAAEFARRDKEAAAGKAAKPQVSFSQGQGQLQVSVPLAGHLPPDQAELLAQVAAKCLAETLAVLGLEKHYTLKQAAASLQSVPQLVAERAVPREQHPIQVETPATSLLEAKGDLQQRDPGKAEPPAAEDSKKDDSMGDKGGKRSLPVEETDDFPQIGETGESSSQPCVKKPAACKAEGDLEQQEDALDASIQQTVQATLAAQAILEQSKRSGSSSSCSSSAASGPSEQRG